VRDAYVGDADGAPRKLFYSVESAVYFYAFLDPDSVHFPDDETHALVFVVRNEKGYEVARLGSAIRVPQSNDLGWMDYPRNASSSGGNGWPLRGSRWASRAGRYRVQVLLDGRPQQSFVFMIKPLRAAGRVRLVTAHLEDAEGNRRTQFSSHDRGVYAHVELVNQSRQAAHDHLLWVHWRGPQGRVGRPLGGVLHVAAGELLDGHDFPQACDAQGHDGLLVHDGWLGKHPGTYHMVVELDGVERADVRFVVTP
jgi:hypothetical protein